MTLYYKALRKGRKATHADGFRWPKPGTWLEVEGDLVPCRNGLHVATLPQLLEHWLHEQVWIVEVDDAAGLIVQDDKMIARRARLVERTGWDDTAAQLFAADCAERVLPIFERERPGDDRPRKAIEAARAYAHGEIDAAARDAAWDAAEAAAWAAARDAAGSAAGSAAWAAAWAAAGDAAWAAAWAAARDAAWAAAWAAEREWQAQRLAHYLGTTL